jgi:NADPH-dependent 2,4-dienoyl-CoA reductase/sulfur reductase-like enzyme
VIACDLAVVGAGPAGLAAAREAADHGLSVVVLDDNARPGGQYFRQPPETFRRRTSSSLAEHWARADELLRALDRPGVVYLPNAVVWDAPEPLTLAYAAGADSGRVRAGCVVVAAGAYDRPVAFPGWTLPGVVTAGGVQNLIKGQCVVPGSRAAVVGNGPLLLVVAANLLRAGVRVAAVAEAAPVHRRAWAQAARLAAAPSILRLGASCRAALLRARAPYRTGETVVAAEGDGEVRAVTLAPIDPAGWIDRARARQIEVDTLVVGFGLTPSVELTRLLGCAHAFDPLRGGWLPVRSPALETSAPGVFAAGDGTGIGGVVLAQIEGQLAGLGAALRLGRANTGRAEGRRRSLAARLSRLDRFRAGLERVFAPPASYLDLLTEDTVVCRCEEVTYGELTARLGEYVAGTGAAVTGMIALKAATRTGMGRCQGRNCLATLAAIVARAQGVAVERLVWPRVRPPARPILLGDLLHEVIPPAVLPDDPHRPRRPIAQMTPDYEA